MWIGNEWNWDLFDFLLQVKDKKEFEFDPAHTVKEICAIYLNLKDCEEFCLAVSQDGRSYSPELFQYAENILSKMKEISENF